MNNPLITDMALHIDMPLTMSLGGLRNSQNIPENALMDDNNFFLLDKNGFWLTSTESNV